jgi:pSer/pThr/pTyr-binding forkhead associated (FHA) protein
MALLCVLDDGKEEGECVRLRGDRCLIGRADGDLRIPHDQMMSGRHAEIVRQKTKDGGYRWVLTDLESTNGTWVRVGRTLLQDQGEILVGRGQYRFEAGSLDVGAAATVSAEATRAYVPGSAGAATAALIEVTPARPGPRYPLTQAEYWIGRDPRACAIARPDDPIVNPRHARLHRDARGQWHVENNKSVNGLWLRVDEIPLGTTCQLRMGEQRFLFRVL